MPSLSLSDGDYHPSDCARGERVDVRGPNEAPERMKDAAGVSRSSHLSSFSCPHPSPQRLWPPRLPHPCNSSSWLPLPLADLPRLTSLRPTTLPDPASPPWMVLPPPPPLPLPPPTSDPTNPLYCDPDCGAQAHDSGRHGIQNQWRHRQTSLADLLFLHSISRDQNQKPRRELFFLLDVDLEKTTTMERRPSLIKKILYFCQSFY